MNRLKNLRTVRPEEGFTLVELMIVVVIIGILAAVAIPIFSNQQKAAIDASAKSDLHQIRNAITLAKAHTKGATLLEITGSNFVAARCLDMADGADLAALPKTHACWVQYQDAMNKISAASKMDITKLVDPYGRPYYIDPNEGEAGGCTKDVIGMYKDPFVGGAGNYALKTSMAVLLPQSSPDCT